MRSALRQFGQKRDSQAQKMRSRLRRCDSWRPCIGDVTRRTPCALAALQFGSLPETVGGLFGRGDGTCRDVVAYDGRVEPFSVAIGDARGDDELGLAGAASRDGDC